MQHIIRTRGSAERKPTVPPRPPATCLAFVLALSAVCSGAFLGTATAQTPPVFLLQWGSQGTGPGQFDNPFGLGVDPDGSVYVTDGGVNLRTTKFTGSGGYVTAWQLPAPAGGALHIAGDIAVDASGTIYASDGTGAIIQVFDHNLNFVRYWPMPGGRGPAYLALDPTGQFLYVSSADDIFAFRTDGTFLRSWVATGTGSGGAFGFGVGPSGDVYIATGSDSHVRRYTSSGNLVLEWGGQGTLDGQFDGSGAVAVDASGTVYVSDGSGRIQEFTPDGVFITKFTPAAGIWDMAVDAAQDIFLLDRTGYRVLKYANAATATRPSTWGRLKALYR